MKAITVAFCGDLKNILLSFSRTFLTKIKWIKGGWVGWWGKLQRRNKMPKRIRRKVKKDGSFITERSLVSFFAFLSFHLLPVSISGSWLSRKGGFERSEQRPQTI